MADQLPDLIRRLRAGQLTGQEALEFEGAAPSDPIRDILAEVLNPVNLVLMALTAGAAAPARTTAQQASPVQRIAQLLGRGETSGGPSGQALRRFGSKSTGRALQRPARGATGRPVPSPQDRATQLGGIRESAKMLERVADIIEELTKNQPLGR
jgi:hypothetical protein